ncbi:hypothetical protein PR048_010932 [Dryococelus australis]|uniref:Uncharacterized protein n=1 Tax=Dryococelus australis TaxID=614101 RepID=A0ABQ9HKT8_9NEOP|nr:hypothetical protein PR048_010932 [Dryococelus australis]
MLKGAGVTGTGAAGISGTLTGVTVSVGSIAKSSCSMSSGVRRLVSGDWCGQALPKLQELECWRPSQAAGWSGWRLSLGIGSGEGGESLQTGFGLAILFGRRAWHLFAGPRCWTFIYTSFLQISSSSGCGGSVAFQCRGSPLGFAASGRVMSPGRLHGCSASQCGIGQSAVSRAAGKLLAGRQARYLYSMSQAVVIAAKPCGSAKQEVDEFLETFKIASELNVWDEPGKCRRIKLYLQGTAKLVYNSAVADSVENVSAWQTIEDRVRKVYMVIDKRDSYYTTAASLYCNNERVEETPQKSSLQILILLIQTSRGSQNEVPNHSAGLCINRASSRNFSEVREFLDGEDVSLCSVRGHRLSRVCESFPPNPQPMSDSLLQQCCQTSVSLTVALVRVAQACLTQAGWPAAGLVRRISCAYCLLCGHSFSAWVVGGDADVFYTVVDESDFLWVYMASDPAIEEIEGFGWHSSHNVGYCMGGVL